MEKRNTVSVVIPIYNEEKYIDKLLLSLAQQDYPKALMEILLVDGMSTDNTRVLIEEHEAYNYMNIKILDNEKRIIPSGVNVGIRAAKGDYIVRLDAHSEYPTDYISKCIETLNNTEADNVGGIVIATNEGFIGEVNAIVQSSKFGVGNSKFRFEDAKADYAETVPFGAFRRETFEKFGLFDEELERNEDNEFNYRIRKNGGKVYLNPEIKVIYHNRDTISGFLKMAFSNGKWNIITLFKSPGAMSIRHFIPFTFVMSLIMFPFLIKLPSIYGKLMKKLFIAEITLYMALNIVFSLKDSLKKGKKYFLPLIGMYPSFHIAYGLGSVFGLIKMLFRRKEN